MEYEDKCVARGVSMVPTFKYCQSLAKLKRMKHHTHAALLKFDSQCGMVLQDKVNHVTWWISASCKPLQMVADVKSLKD